MRVRGTNHLVARIQSNMLLHPGSIEVVKLVYLNSAHTLLINKIAKWTMVCLLFFNCLKKYLKLNQN